MGYTTTFEGSFAVTPPLQPEHAEYLREFSRTCHMKRNAEIAATLPDPLREAVGLPIGVEGGFFVGGRGEYGDSRDESIVNANDYPDDQPGMWCQWTPNDDGTAIVWDEGVKFYEYVAWLEYLIRQFLTPWGYRIRGAVRFEGEDRLDVGVLYADGENVHAGYPDDCPPPRWYSPRPEPRARRREPQNTDHLLVALDQIESCGCIDTRDLDALRRLVEQSDSRDSGDNVIAGRRVKRSRM